MKNYKYWIVLFTSMIITGNIYAQVVSGISPVSFTNEELFECVLSSTNTITLPALNNETEQQRAQVIYSAKSGCSDCGDQYYGRGIDVSVDLKEQGTLHTLSNGDQIWTLRLTSETAYGMQFYFNEFNLPEGADLFIYNQDRTMMLGSYTSENNPSDPNQVIKFGTEYLQGNIIIFEYYEPYDAEFEGEICITNIIHIFKNFFNKSQAHIQKG